MSETQGPPLLALRSPPPVTICPSPATACDGSMEPITPSKCSSSMDNASDAGILDGQTETEDRNSEFQIAWSNVMSKGPYSSPSYYKRTAVLLFSWVKGFNGMDVEEEIDELGEVFETLFNYETKKVYLEPSSPTEGTNLQSKVSAMIANFNLEFDGHNTLLIVYYAGHGRPGLLSSGDLALGGGNGSPSEDDDSAEHNQVIWNKTEQLLKEAVADVFVIFDCCHAGELARDRMGHRPFDYLAATQHDGYTKFPGKNSFTAALIWSLRTLKREKPDGRFTTYELLVAVKDRAPNFSGRQEQEPELHPRRDPRGKAGRIMLHPIARERDLVKESPKFTPDSKAELEILTLHYWFDHKLTRKDITDLGSIMNDLFNQHNFHISRIAYGGLEPSFVSLAAAGFMRKIHKRRYSGLPPNLKPNPKAKHPLEQWRETLSTDTPFPEHSREALIGSPGYHFRMLLQSICDPSKEWGLPFMSMKNWTVAWMIFVLAVLLAILISH